MFDGEEIPTNSTRIEGEPSDDREAGDVDENEHSFPHTNPDDPQGEAIELQEIQVERRVDTSEDGRVTISNQNMQEPDATIQPLEVFPQEICEIQFTVNAVYCICVESILCSLIQNLL